jgi:hypothetical protein
MFTIKYYQFGKEVGSSQWNCSLEDTIRVATDGLAQYHANAAIITDDQGGEAAVVKS